MRDFLYCLNTSTIRPTPLLEKVHIAGQLGYDAIEPWNDEITDYLRAGGTLKDLRRIIEDEGLKVVSVIALFGWTEEEPAKYAAALDECRRRMDQAVRLGSPYIVASPPSGVVDLGFAARRYADLLRLGREIGVRPSMEFLGFVEGVHTLDSARIIADGSGDRDATVVADVFHMMRGGGSIDDLLTIPGDRMAIFHINDLPDSPPPREQTDADRVMLGEGIADLPRVIENLRSIDYRGPISLELFNEGLWILDPSVVCRVGLEQMRKLVEGE
ncbi:MAG: sugar phosphate isomerase/epimerase [Planctomycetota bacterium]|nr:sugar phosphate isomerase/epimerase [Planctomycetota bacterium]